MIIDFQLQATWAEKLDQTFGFKSAALGWELLK